MYARSGIYSSSSFIISPVLVELIRTDYTKIKEFGRMFLVTIYKKVISYNYTLFIMITSCITQIVFKVMILHSASIAYTL